MVTINTRSSTPIYEQIVEQIKESVLKGFLKRADLIPSVRKLAIMINVNPNTVSKAYKELERQKIIETLQGKGTFIADINIEEDAFSQDKLIVIRDKLKVLLIEMKYLNIDDKKIIDEILGILKNLNSNQEG